MSRTTWDRRQLIAAALGAPVAAAWSATVGCRGGSDAVPPLPPGRLVGAAFELGHRARDAANAPLDPALPVTEVETIVVGGGIAGLSAARELLRRGHDDLLLLEIEPRPGGTAAGDASRSDFTVPVPWGAHYIPAPTRENPELLALLDEFGAFDGVDEHGEPRPREDWSPRAPESRFWFRGSWYEGLYAWPGAGPEELAELKRFEDEIDRWVAWRDAAGRRAFTLPSDLGSDDPEVRSLDRRDMRSWMRDQGFSSERLSALVDHACRDDYGATIDETSAWAGIFYFAARRAAPGRESRPYLTWPQGNGFVATRLAEPLGDRLRTDCAVIRIEATADEPRRYRIGAIDGGRPRCFASRRLIFAAPQFLAPYLIADLGEAASVAGDSEGTNAERLTRRDAAHSFRYGAWVVANLQLDRPPAEAGFPIAWDNVIHDSPSLGYLATSYQRGIDRGPTVWTWYYPLTGGVGHDARRQLASAGRDDWAEIALADLGRPHPDIRERVRRIDVMRWGHAMICPVPGFRFSSSRRIGAEAWRGIEFAHSDLSGLPLFEEAFARGSAAGRRIAERIERERSERAEPEA